jgi:hypothetical protein
LREPLVGTIVCLGIGIGLLLFQGFIPLFSYASGSVTANNITLPTNETVPSLLKGDKAFDGCWQGKVIMIVTFLVAAFVVASLILYLTISPAVSDLLLTISSCIAGGWSLTLTLWFVAFIWKVFTLSSKVKELFQKPFFGGGIQINLTPGIGLWLGLAIALGTVAVFSTLMTLRNKMVWIYLGEGIGLLLGLLMMLVAVQPWKTPADGFQTPGGGRGPFMHQVTPERSTGGLSLVSPNKPKSRQT